MKKNILALLSLFISITAFSQPGYVGIGTQNPTDQLHTTGTVRLEGYRGYGTRLVEIDSSGRMQVTGGGNINGTTPSAAIPDNQCSIGNGVTSTINISGQPFAIQSSQISVRVNMTHSNDADLSVFLLAPNGAILRLLANTGAGGANLSGTVFSDVSQVSINSGFAPFTGVFKPVGGLSAGCLLTPTVGSFGGIGGGSIVPNGNWTLKVFDGTPGQTGTLDKWEISFSGPESFLTYDNNGYVPYFNQGNLSPSPLYFASGYLGVGTNGPAYNLDVAGTFHISGNVNIQGDISAPDLYLTGTFSSPTATFSNYITTNSATVNSAFTFAGGTPVAGKVLTASNASGLATWQTPGTGISFDTYLTNPVSIPQGSYVPSGFTKKYEDGGLNFNTTTGVYTAPSAGVYEFHASAGWGPATTGTTISYLIRLRLNFFGGGTTATQSSYLMPSLTGNGVVIETSHIFKLNAGDQVYMEVSHSFASNIQLNGGISSSTSTFSGVKLY